MPDTAGLPTLLQAWRDAKTGDPHARARDIADKLGVPEGALVEARTGEGITRLTTRGEDAIPLLSALTGLGPVMTLTRNQAAVHETTGPMGEVAAHGLMGQVTGDIDLRMFLRHWHVVYAISEEARSGLRHSIQIFDVTGQSVIKIYATDETDMASWRALIEGHRDSSTALTTFSPPVASRPDAPDDEIDANVLRREWLTLQHSHDFHKMLRELGIGRAQALRLAGDDLARRIPVEAVETILRGAADQQIPIMCFVGNPGCIQIFSGPISRIEPMGPWLNVLDPGFNLHLRTDRVATVWMVRKPTEMRGDITSVELYDDGGELVCQFFGARPPGEGERPAWRALVQKIGGAA
ncbi:MAG: ChuX/HutX family heme-like substrate-binding protein [Pseudomonadota bacterium]